MRKHPDIEQKVEDALRSMDGLQPAEAPPHLYTRIRAGLEKPVENNWSWIASVLSKPSVALALSIILIAINAWIILGNQRNLTDDKNDQVAALAQEYHFDHPYPLEQNVPQP
jgi:hypothetical protein